MTTIARFTTHVRTVSVLILASFGILAVEMRIVKWLIMSLFAPAQMVTSDHLKLTADHVSNPHFCYSGMTRYKRIRSCALSQLKSAFETSMQLFFRRQKLDKSKIENDIYTILLFCVVESKTSMNQKLYVSKSDVEQK